MNLKGAFLFLLPVKKGETVEGKEGLIGVRLLPAGVDSSVQHPDQEVGNTLLANRNCSYREGKMRAVCVCVLEREHLNHAVLPSGYLTSSDLGAEVKGQGSQKLPERGSVSRVKLEWETATTKSITRFQADRAGFQHWNQSCAT